jgi:spoIIIJ-associated protein
MPPEDTEPREHSNAGEIDPAVEGAGVVAEGATVGEAKWAAMKELELRYPGLVVEQVKFEVLEERPAGEEGGFARVRATPDVPAWEASEREFEWPEEPAERVREILRRICTHLGLRASVDIEEDEDELRASLSGTELALFIGKHGQTIDAIQLLCAQAAYRGRQGRKRVVVDAGGYRERRAAALRRQADRGVSDALRYGRAVELDAMSASERRVVHVYLQERPEVETHSEGDEPYRRIVISPVSRGSGGPA